MAATSANAVLVLFQLYEYLLNNPQTGRLAR
jgi:hypothetical protein